MGNYKKVDETNLKVLSDRRNSVTYLSDDKKWMYKKIKAIVNGSVDDLLKEKNIMEHLKRSGISTPAIGELVEFSDGEIGMEYQYVEGKKSYARLISEDFSKLDEYMEKFTKKAKVFHNTICDTDEIVKTKELLISAMDKNPLLFDEKRRDKTLNLIAKLPDDNTFNLGDFQPSNFIVSDNGEFVIDISTVARGDKLVDIGFYSFLLHNSGENVITLITRCPLDKADIIWRSFLSHYFDFKTDKEIDEFNEFLKPYVAFGIMAFSNYMPTFKEGDRAFTFISSTIDSL